MLAWHINIGLQRRSVLTDTPAARRTWVRSVHRFFRETGLLAVSCPATHAHLLVCGDRSELGRRVHALECSLSWHLGLDAPFRPAWFEPVRDQSHLESAFRYVLTNRRRHGLFGDAVGEASNIPDLLGARELLGWTRSEVRRRLPTVDRRHLTDLLGLEPRSGTDARLVLEAASAATGFEVLGRSQGSVRARSTAAALGLALGLRPLDLAARLGVHPSRVRRLAARATGEALATARVQLGLLEQAGREAERRRHQAGHERTRGAPDARLRTARA
jgi:hypothetical protein